MRQFTYIILAALALCSCRRDEVPMPAQESVAVTFTVTVPGQVHSPTRAGVDTDIANIDLLIFDESYEFVERIAADAIEGSGADKTFTVVLDASDTPRLIHIVANGRTSANIDRINFSDITPAMPESTAIPALVTAPMPVASEGAVTPLVMWGRILLSSIGSSTVVGGVNLLRSQAAIHVGKATPDASNGLDNFEITSSTLHSAASRGKVAQAEYDEAPVRVQTSPNEASAPRVNYYDAGGYISTGSTPVLYLYERENTTADHLSLIIGGEWNGTPGYYKVILNDEEDVPYQIIRNHRYIVTIVRASGTGFPTIAEAVENEASNIEIEITDARDDLHFIYSDATVELGASHNVVKVFRSASTASKTIDIATIFATPDPSLSPSFSSNVAGLTALGFYDESPDGTRKLRGTFSGSTGSGRITVMYGKLTHTIDVVSASGTWEEGEAQAVIYPHAFLEAANNPWVATIRSESTQYFRIHNILDRGAHYNSNGFTSYGSTSLAGSGSDGAWIYSLKSFHQIGIIDVSYMDSGNFKKGQVIIYPY